MQKLPIELAIRRPGQEGTEHVLCKTTLRVIPNNREVFDGQWKGKAVIVKVFSRGLVCRLRFERERRGLTELGRRGINAPRPVFIGKTAEGKPAIVTEKVSDSQTLAEVYRRQDKIEKRAELLARAAAELAAEHQKGVVQTDLHLGNFLLQGEKLFAIDPAAIRFFKGPIGRKKSYRQLALLTSNLDSRKGCCAGKETEAARSVWREYFNGRKWQLDKPDEQAILEQMSRHRRNWIRHAMSKCLRTSKRFVQIKAAEYLAVVDRGFCEGNEPNDFVRQIDELSEKGEALKRGRTSCVWRLKWNGRDIVVKRYNHKGFFHSLRHTLKGSRAKQGWANGHRLRCLGISTPRPLAYIESRKCGLVWMSYLITAYVAGRNLHNILNDETVNEDKRSIIIQQVLALIESIVENKITHRDLKLTNILVTDEGPVLTDLDAVKVHKLRQISRWKGRKYLERLQKSVEEKSV